MRMLFLVCVILSGSLEAQRSDFRDTDFACADSIAALYPKHSLHDLKGLVYKLTSDLATEQEKFRAIYRWVCNNVKSDYKLYLETIRMRKKIQTQGYLTAWNRRFSATVFRKLLREHKTICSGYAYLVRELALCAGLSCQIVNGYGRTANINIGGTGIPNHSWNAIKLNGKWYLCDATWSSGSIDGDKGSFLRSFEDAYFLAEPSLFVRDHYPLDTAWILKREKPTLQEFLNAPLIYPAAHRFTVTPMFPETFNVTTSKGALVSFCFRKNGKEINTIGLQVNGNSRTDGQYYQSGISNEVYCIDHTFSGRGMFTVHIRVNTIHAVTYVVVVK